MRKGVLIGLFLIFLPAVLYLIAAVRVTRISTVFDTSFVLEPGEKREPIEYCVDPWAARNILKGVVSVEGERIKLIIEGYPRVVVYMDNIQLHNLTIWLEEGRQHNLTVWLETEEALGIFTFDNTNGNATSVVNFLLKAEITKFLIPIVLALEWLPFAVLMPIGLIVLIISYYKSSNRLVSP